MVTCTAIFAAACSSSSNPTTTDNADASADGGEERDTGANLDSSSPDSSDASEASITPTDAGPTCNALPNAAPPVTVTEIASQPPAAQGGTIADGTYFLTSATIYTGEGGATGSVGSGQSTVTISGTTVQMATSGEPTTRTVTLITNGTTFTATDTCPDSSVATGSYSATASTLVILLAAGTADAGAKTLAETFTKQ
jgi:hypothetical protein